VATATILLDLVIAGPPVSQQTRRRERVRDYRNEVGARAAEVLSGAPPIAGMVRVEITFFYDAVAGDVDNIAKPILDGLKGVVIADDAQVMDVLVSKRPVVGTRVVDPSEQVLQFLATGREFVHVRVLPFNL
jgi:crossover junction endodeoxyribonuclease RusA